MNIRVDLNYPIKNGTELVFRSPVDCSQVTGLKVYYIEGVNHASKEFVFADAHGYNVGDVPHLFAESVVVKVILDVSTGMAFVQNADTNAYLEERFSQIQQDIADLKYVPIDITGISNNVGTKEKGRSVSSVTISWVVNKEPKSQNLDGVTLDVSARSKTIPGQFSTTQKFVVEVIDEKGKKDAESTTISFLNGVYYGALDANATIDSDAINSMGRSLQSGITGTFKMTAAEGQKLTFAAPVSYGEPTKFTSGGLDYTWDKVKTNFNHKNQSEHTEPYNVWQNSEITVGTFSVTVVK